MLCMFSLRLSLAFGTYVPYSIHFWSEKSQNNLQTEFVALLYIHLAFDPGNTLKCC